MIENYSESYWMNHSFVERALETCVLDILRCSFRDTLWSLLCFQWLYSCRFRSVPEYWKMTVTKIIADFKLVAQNSRIFDNIAFANVAELPDSSQKVETLVARGMRKKGQNHPLFWVYVAQLVRHQNAVFFRVFWLAFYDFFWEKFQEFSLKNFNKNLAQKIWFLTKKLNILI